MLLSWAPFRKNWAGHEWLVDEARKWKGTEVGVRGPLPGSLHHMGIFGILG